MKSDSLPTATSPRPTDDIEVLSQRAPIGRIRGETPMGSNVGGRSKFGPQPDTAPEPPVVLDSVWRPLTKGGEPSMSMAFVHLEASDNLLEALRGTSIDEEHHTIMSAVVEKVQPPKAD